MKPVDFLMFSGNRWALYKIDVWGYQSWIYHCCNPMAARFTVNRFLSVTEILDDTIKCWKCQQQVPDDIVTLWRLHNFDAIGESPKRTAVLNAALAEYDIQDDDQ